MKTTNSSQAPTVSAGRRARRPAGLRLGTLLIAITSAAPLASAIDLEDVLYGIQMVESSGRDIGKHPDGVTYGRYGVTYMAVKELRRLRQIGDAVVDLSDPATNRQMATLYLKHLKKRYGSWWSAVKQYNPRSTTYAPKVWAEIDRREQLLAATR